MSSSRLARWGGLAAVMGGRTARDMGIPPDPGVQPMGMPGSLYRLYIALWSLSWLLLVGGLVGVHNRQVNAYGRLGTAGFAIASLGGLLVAVLSFVYSEWPGPYSWGDGSGFRVAVLIWEVGLLLLGVATLRARALPLASFLVFPLSIMLTPLMLVAGLESEFFYSGAPRALSGLGWVLLGYPLWSGVGEGVRRSAPAR